ncbi:MAG: DUF3343 domain-containing protein [Synergistaceae bacterium]|nr:DUF3343 domain-containing protein [Synergistaceae bacterium]
MSEYVATFYSHYDALIFYNFLKENNVIAKLTPVPRKVSASCGTCVLFSSDTVIDFTGHELEALYIETSDGYKEVDS